MKTVILAAGAGSRLKPLTDHSPKCLLKTGAKRILEMTIENLLATNNSEIIIVTGYLEKEIRKFIRERFPKLKITYIYNEFYASTNNIYSLWLVKDTVQGDDMMMMDSDIVFDKRIISKLLNSGYKNCLALKRHDVHDEEIKVKTDTKGCVIEISKEVKISEAAGESIGIEIFSKEALTELYSIIDRKVVTEKNVNQFYEAAFQELSLNDLYIVDITEYFCMEIDTEEDLKKAEVHIFDQLVQEK
ncbi:MAG: phosphocholine cytidylyltransferase family protein [Bacteroidales bacterium]